ncbi:MAG: hypothetical protein ACRBN8_20960 [Nannocystales bacterium]
MALRPISGWAYAGTGDVSGWASLDGQFSNRLGSDTGLANALDKARSRWGLARVGCLNAGASWGCAPPDSAVGFSYAKLGPDADAGTLRSAWALVERGVADAVWVRSPGAEFLVERTGDGPVGLSPGSVPRCDLALDVDARSLITAVVVGAAVIELGLRCAPGGTDPERVCVQAPQGTWQMELRS